MKDIIDIKCKNEVKSRIVIGSIADDFTNLIPEDNPRVIIITDARVHSSNMTFINSYDHIVIGQGESTKTLIKLEEIYRQLLDLNADRNTFIIGMGGGIVSDITGFVASTYMRGVRFAFIPTTLLAQVDASVGGKNGINLDGYKNIIGTFNQPQFILCDPELLSSLSDKEFKAGLAEIIKIGIIENVELFEILKAHSLADIRADKNLLHDIIFRSIQTKTAIVERDEREHGERRKLNLGHTFAHAIEKIAPNFSHGEAVAIGLYIISEAAVRCHKLPQETALRIKEILLQYELSIECPVEMRRLLSAIKQDKKREGKIINLIFPNAIGICSIEQINITELDNIFTCTTATKIEQPEVTASSEELTA